MDNESQRRTYGRGFYDGQKKALEQMNNSRIESLERGLTDAARRVLDVTPIAEPWSIVQLCTELRRQGHSSEHRVVSGCVHSLVASGLVREPKPGYYIRTAAKPKLAALPRPDQEAASAQQEQQEHEPEPTDPLSRIASLGVRLKEIAESIVLVAKDMEDMALEIAEHQQRTDGRMAKMSQLQRLLKELGAD